MTKTIYSRLKRISYKSSLNTKNSTLQISLNTFGKLYIKHIMHTDCHKPAKHCPLPAVQFPGHSIQNRQTQKYWSRNSSPKTNLLQVFFVKGNSPFAQAPPQGEENNSPPSHPSIKSWGTVVYSERQPQAHLWIRPCFLRWLNSWSQNAGIKPLCPCQPGEN